MHIRQIISIEKKEDIHHNKVDFNVITKQNKLKFEEYIIKFPKENRISFEQLVYLFVFTVFFRFYFAKDYYIVIRCLPNTLLTEAQDTPNNCNYSRSMLLLASLAYLQLNIIRLPDDLPRNTRLFAVDNSLFCVVISVTHLKNEIRKISNWVL